MGSLCSKASAHEGSHQVLGGSNARQDLRRQPEGTSAGPVDPRKAAAEAAERRVKDAKSRGTHASNPKRGHLTAQLEAAKTAKPARPQRQEQQLVWD